MKRKGEHCIIGIICDGIGGLQEGENASGYVVRQIISWFLTMGYKWKGRKKKESALQQVFYQIHEELKSYGTEKGIRLGTTVTFFLSDKKGFLWGHCGDSRLYYWHRGKMKQMTRNNCEKNGALNRAIGTGEWHKLTMGYQRWRTNDKILLCTDGFYRKLDEKELERWFQGTFTKDLQAERILKQIGQRKIAMGEKDNISALYCGREKIRKSK